MKNWLFRNTASSKGRTISMTPKNSAFKFLSTGRIILDKELSEASGQNAGSETTLLCLHGKGKVVVEGKSYELSRFDGIYISRGLTFQVSTDEYIDVVEASCPTEKNHPVKYVNFEQDV